MLARLLFSSALFLAACSPVAEQGASHSLATAAEPQQLERLRAFLEEAASDAALGDFVSMWRHVREARELDAGARPEEIDAIEVALYQQLIEASGRTPGPALAVEQALAQLDAADADADREAITQLLVLRAHPMCAIDYVDRLSRRGEPCVKVAEVRRVGEKLARAEDEVLAVFWLERMGRVAPDATAETRALDEQMSARWRTAWRRRARSTAHPFQPLATNCVFESSFDAHRIECR